MIWLVDQEPTAARSDGCRSNSELARRRTHMLPVKARRLAVRAASCISCVCCIVSRTSGMSKPRFVSRFGFASFAQADLRMSCQ